MPGKIVKTLTISGILNSFEIIEGVPDFGESREMVACTTLSDSVAQERAHPIKKYTAVTFKVADKGTRPETTATGVKVTFAATDEAGAAIGTARDYMAVISEVTPESIAVDGNRVPAYSVTISPTGETVPQA